MTCQREMRKVFRIYRIISLVLTGILYVLFVPAEFFLKMIVLAGMTAGCVLELRFWEGENKVWNRRLVLFWMCAAWNSLLLCLTGVMTLGFTDKIYQSLCWKILAASGFALLLPLIILLAYYVESMELEQKKNQFLLSMQGSTCRIDELVLHMDQMLDTKSSMWLLMDEQKNIQKYNSQNMDMQIQSELIHMVEQRKWDEVQRIESKMIMLDSGLYCVSFFAYQTRRWGIYIYRGRSEGAILRKRHILYQYLQVFLKLLKRMNIEETGREV